MNFTHFFSITQLPTYPIPQFLSPNSLTVVLNPSDNEFMPSLSSKLAPITLPDTDGQPVQLGSLWASRPAVVVFLRHWG